MTTKKLTPRDQLIALQQEMQEGQDEAVAAFRHLLEGDGVAKLEETLHTLQGDMIPLSPADQQISYVLQILAAVRTFTQQYTPIPIPPAA